MKVCFGQNYSYILNSSCFLFFFVTAGPNQSPLKTHVTGNHHGGYRVEYTPVEVGMSSKQN